MKIGSVVLLAGEPAVIKETKFENGCWWLGVKINTIDFLYWARLA